MSPIGKVRRRTRETAVELELELDGRGRADIDTGIPFLDHMLHLFAAHGYFDLKLKATGDLEVDQHHTVEDIGICLGHAIREALQQRPGVRRFGSGPGAHGRGPGPGHPGPEQPPFPPPGGHPAPRPRRPGPPTAEGVLAGRRVHGGITLHITVPYGDNTHHILEAIFKAAGRALDSATPTRTPGPGRALHQGRAVRLLALVAQASRLCC